MSKNPMKVTSKPLRARNLVLRSERTRKREEAKVRQGIYDSLTLAEKFAKLDAGGFVARKQRAKLRAQQYAAEEAKNPGSIQSANPAAVKEEFKKGAKAERQRRKDKKAAKAAKA